jgi:hypothetical protein
LEENEDLYNFNKEYQDNIIKKFNTIKKAIRGKELWHQVATEKEARVEKRGGANHRQQAEEALK